jgi:hypothetical protein
MKEWTSVRNVSASQENEQHNVNVSTDAEMTTIKTIYSKFHYVSREFKKVY